MSVTPIAISGTGLVTSVGLTAPAACAAIRAGLTNPVETRYVDSAGEWIMSHGVPLQEQWLGREKLAHMAAMVVRECLVGTPAEEWQHIPLLLCVAEPARPGRVDGLDGPLLEEVQQLLGWRCSPESTVVPHGRVGFAVALLRARKLIYESSAKAVLVVAADSLLGWPTLKVLEKQGRLLTKANSNGFLPGEGASGVLVSRPASEPQLLIKGLGFAIEAAHIDAELPLRAEGMTGAIHGALHEAGCAMHDLDFRIADLSGEQYYFKEAALALSRSLRQRKEQMDIWHPAECIGESGSVIGPAMLAVADAACRKGYAAGRSILLHAANDAGQRAAIVARFAES